MILATCLKAGHRWGRAIRSDIPHGGWVEIRQCQRRRCDRLKTVWDNGVAFTYRLDRDGQVVERRKVAK